jgi:TPR repeat protein
MNRKHKFFGKVAGATLMVALLVTGVAMADSPKIDASAPVEQLKTLATAGNADAMIELADRLVEGRGLDKNPQEALKWFQQAADAGNAQGWYGVGFMYSDGRLGTPDAAKGMTYFRKGAEAGNADCQASLGLYYQAGEKIPGGVKADPAEAVKWYRLAAAQNHTEAIQHLAMMNAMGMGITRDAAEAVKWFRKGVELGDADCKWGLGQCYLDGKGVPQDTIQAYALFSASLDGVKNPAQKQAMTERRDELGKALTAEQLKKTEPLIQEWKTKENK